MEYRTRNTDQRTMKENAGNGNAIMEKSIPQIYSLSETAITIEFGNEINEHIHRKVIVTKQSILQNQFKGIIEVVTAYTTVTVFYNPVEVLKSSTLSGNTPNEKVHQYLKNLLKETSDDLYLEKEEVISIPVCYDEEFALDLEWLADFHKTTTPEIIRRHVRNEYIVFMIGFTPGFPYMGVLPAELDTPRKQNPRTSVPAGSVGIAGRQTGIYPFATPGGWQIIGRTPIKLFSPENSQPSFLKAGDRVRFESISKDEFNRMNS